MAANATEYLHDSIRWNVHCPDVLFKPGKYRWKYRGWTDDGQHTRWSRERTFSISKEAAAMPMPGKQELLNRIPSQHPRLFLRPEQIPALKSWPKAN